MSPTNDSTEKPVDEPKETTSQKRAPPKDAFSELMAPKKARPETSTSTPPHRPHQMHHPRPQVQVIGWNTPVRAGGSDRKHAFPGSDAFGAYIADPTSAACRDAVVFYNDDFVALRDKFAKSAVHCLLLPRSAEYSRAQPLALFSRTDEAAVRFLDAVRAEAGRLAQMVAADLERRFGQFSVSDAARQAVLRCRHERDQTEKNDKSETNETNEANETNKLPDGRDWRKEVMVGVHTRPSMAHLHIHVMSRDMHSDKMKKRKHYNSFTTPFFVGLDEFPLAANDARLTGRRVDHLKDEMQCWRCGRNFGNKFAELKRHLDTEFDLWKKE